MHPGGLLRWVLATIWSEVSKFLINCGEDIGVWAGCEEDDVINLNVSIDTLLLLFASNILRSVLLRTE